MRARGKILISILLAIILGLALWQFASPPILTPVGTRYASSTVYSNRGSWTLLETMRYGRIFLAFSIANLTFPKTSLPTGYSVIISNVNQTLSSTYVRGFGLRITSLTVQDNYDGSTAKWGNGNFTDAAQVGSVFQFHTSATHQLNFTINYTLYDLFLLGYTSDHGATGSFNATQSVL